MSYMGKFLSLSYIKRGDRQSDKQHISIMDIWTLIENINILQNSFFNINIYIFKNILINL